MRGANHSRLRTLWWPLLGSLLALAALAFVLPRPAFPGDYLQRAESPTLPAPQYLGQVIITAVPEGVSLPHDVLGRVLNKDGAGVANVQVRVSSPGWEATSRSGSGGDFQFTLGQGAYTIELVGVSSRAAFIVIDGKSRVRVEFREITPLATATPSATPGKTPTPTPTTTGTPTPTATVRLPLAEVIAATRPAPTRTAMAADSAAVAVTSLLPLPDFNPKPWITPFLWGAAFGIAVLLLGLALTLVRR